ncbi:MAG: hypothetical protein R3F11_20470 [Verrucomicrobiales bacterium]
MNAPDSSPDLQRHRRGSFGNADDQIVSGGSAALSIRAALLRGSPSAPLYRSLCGEPDWRRHGSGRQRVACGGMALHRSG